MSSIAEGHGVGLVLRLELLFWTIESWSLHRGQTALVHLMKAIGAADVTATEGALLYSVTTYALVAAVSTPAEDVWYR